MTALSGEYETVLCWKDPEIEPPDFNERILVALGSWEDRGAGFKPKVTITTAKVMQEDVDGSEDGGEEMAADLNSGIQKWGDLQFRLLDDDDEELDTYSDSIKWWAEIPDLPDERKKP